MNLTQLKAAAYKSGFLLKFTGEYASDGTTRLYALFSGRVRKSPARTVAELNIEGKQ